MQSFSLIEVTLNSQSGKSRKFFTNQQESSKIFLSVNIKPTAQARPHWFLGPSTVSEQGGTVSFFVLYAPRLVMLLGALGEAPPQMQEVGNCVIFCAKQAALGQLCGAKRRSPRARAGRVHACEATQQGQRLCSSFRDISHAFFALCASLFFIVEAMTFRTCRTGHSIILVHSAMALFYITCKNSFAFFIGIGLHF